MRRALLLPMAFIAVAVVIIVMSSKGKRGPEPRVEIRFMEFTNAPDGPAAVLAVHYRPRFGGCHWREFTTSRRVDGAWQPWSPGQQRAEHKFIGQTYPPPVGRDGKIINNLLVLPVENTNDAWRFVQRIQESPPLPPPLERQLRAWWHRSRKIVEPPRETQLLPAYHITNETSRAAIRKDHR